MVPWTYYHLVLFFVYLRTVWYTWRSKLLCIYILLCIVNLTKDVQKVVFPLFFLLWKCNTVYAYQKYSRYSRTVLKTLCFVGWYFATLRKDKGLAILVFSFLCLIYIFQVFHSVNLSLFISKMLKEWIYWKMYHWDMRCVQCVQCLSCCV